jgi:secreted trypsin-like serine protease
MAKTPISLAPIPIERPANQIPVIIAKEPKKKVKILAHIFLLANEKAIAIGPNKSTDKSIRLTRSAKDSIKVVLQQMKKISSAFIAIFTLFIGLISTPANAVVGGTDATGSGFVVAIRVDLPGDLQTACTGGLWKPKIVVTAAHCVVAEGSSTVANASEVHVYAQGVTVSGARPVASATAIILTGGYSNSSTGFVEANDLAFLILDKEIGTPLISRLASESEAAAATVLGKKMNIFGYGQTAKDSDVSMIPLTLSQTPFRFLGGKTYLYGKSASGSGACFGDSGGPVILQTETENLLVGPIAGGSGTPCYPEIKDRAVLGLVASNFTDLVKTALTTAGYSADEAFTTPRPSLKKGTFSAKTVLKKIGVTTASSTSVKFVGVKAKPAGACVATATSVIVKSKGTCTLTFTVKKSGKTARTAKTTFNIG